MAKAVPESFLLKTLALVSPGKTCLEQRNRRICDASMRGALRRNTSVRMVLCVGARKARSHLYHSWEDMSNRSGNAVIVILAAIVAIVIWGFAAYLLLVVPHEAEMLADQGAPLSRGMQIAIESSDFLKQYAIILFPIFIGIAWLPFYAASCGE